MEDLLHEALAVEAERAGIIDLDVLRAFPEEIKTAILGADGKPDVASIVGAIRKIRTRSPALFKEQDFQKMDDATYKTAESAFLDKMRRRSNPSGARNSDYRSLDAALLTDEESQALRRFLSGTRSSYDRSILDAARARQNPKDAA